MIKILLLLVIFFAPGAAAIELAPADRLAIRGAVEGQLAAFKRDDGSGAFAYASPRVQAIFKDPDTFMAMVRTDYEAVYRPKAVSFRDLETVEGHLVQPVLIIGPTGAPITALYIMERQADGAWRIGGCVLTAEPGKGI